MRCHEIIQKLEELSPLSFAESWDNVGLLVGQKDKKVERICLAVDATEEVIEEAIRRRADMLITHHPLIFSGLKQVREEDFVGRRVMTLIQNDICYYAMHTNFDIMGMADAAADEFGLQEREVLSITYEDEISKEGLGRFGKLPYVMSLGECAEYVKTRFNIPWVRVYGDCEAMIATVAILPGSGEDYLKDGIKANVDVMITGDIKYHVAMDTVAKGMAIIDAGHYEVEKIFLPYVKEYLEREFPEITVYSVKQNSSFYVI